ncbi:MFS transporter [Alteromonas lipolytica]|uniref:Major facilitator superfamily (MFS) profile domain-containing protein n=1 Tax=Alteromonas lipolytica TaxID=1856405 RepID=A0A1E8FDI2_9ALTE|nr:MFS transporter [Alteromonas lipolytica]OFI33995.1 hypothetical protein BFC17_20795 [Alteromonas lipolytica]GGF66475.1 MFS transporter [Alteromonas lipolytica]
MKYQSNATFWIAACSFVLVFMTAGTPISLFNLYQAEDGLSNADLGVVSLGYFLAAATALLMCGRLSNHLGRKPMALTAIGCCAASCVLLMFMTDVSFLFAARLFQGFACGIATSSIGAYAVDAGENQPKWLVAAVVSTSPMVGIPLGAISSGALVTWGPYPKVLIFAVILAMLLVCLVLLMRCHETVVKQPGAISSLIPRLHFPTGKSLIFIATTGVVVSTWAAGGFYQAFGPSIVAEQLAMDSAIVAAITFSSVMGLTPFGSYLSGRLSPRHAVQVGMALFCLAAVCITLALLEGWLMMFIAASLSVGIAQGLASTACIKLLLHDEPQLYRAGLLSTVYIVSYAGAVFPAMGASIAASWYSVFTIWCGYAVLGIVAAVTALIATVFAAKAREAQPVAG